MLAMKWYTTLALVALASISRAGDPVDETKLIALDGWVDYQFGNDVDVLGDVAVVSQWRDDSTGLGSGSAYIWRFALGEWELEQKLTPLSHSNRFGASVAVGSDFVAVCSNDFDVLFYAHVAGSWSESDAFSYGGGVVQASLDADDSVVVFGSGFGIGLGAGGVRVYRSNGLSWTEEAWLYPGAFKNPQYGSGPSPVSIGGEWLVMGYPSSYGVPGVAGAVFVFHHAGGTWTEVQMLTPSDGADGDEFGASVSVRGSRLAVGAPNHDAGGANAGAAYLFELDGSSWVEAGKLSPPDLYPNDRFGTSLDIQANSLVVGCPRDDEVGSGSGSVYVFERAGTTWVQTTKLVASDGAAFDALGSSVALDTNRVIAGAPMDDFGSGSAYVFAVGNLGPGTPFCFGNSPSSVCPCGNESPALGEGCLHSGGSGMEIDGGGSGSITADDLIIEATSCPQGNTGIFFAGKTSIDPGLPLFDGVQCVGGDVRRFQPLFQDSGIASDTGFVAQDPSRTYFNAGDTVYFQYWSRDAVLASPCGTGANFSPAYAVTMEP